LQNRRLTARARAGFAVPEKPLFILRFSPDTIAFRFRGFRQKTRFIFGLIMLRIYPFLAVFGGKNRTVGLKTHKPGPSPKGRAFFYQNL